MKRYTSYIALHLFLPLVVITLTLTLIIWLARSIRFIDLIVNQGLGVGTFLYLSSLVMPSLLLVILPIALFCSVILVYNRLIMDSELLVLKGAGISRIGLATPALIIATGVMLANYLLALYVMPKSYREFKDMQVFVRENYASLLLQEGVFSTPVPGLTVYIDKRKDGGMLRGIMVHDNRDREKPVTLMAEEGRFLQTEQGPRLELVHGNRQEINRERGSLSMLYFDNYVMDISVYAKKQTLRDREPEERFLGELLFPETANAVEKAKFIAEGHHRLVWPFYTVILTLIALAALLSGQFNRRGLWRRILVAALVALMLVVGDLLLKSLITANASLAVLLYLHALLYTGGSVYLLTANRASLRHITGVIEPYTRWCLEPADKFVHHLIGKLPKRRSRRRS